MRTLEQILAATPEDPAGVMGILNVTPDSFSDGGQFLSASEAVARARAMIDAGAEIIDVGAESTRPGSDRVGDTEQIDRLREIIPAVCELGAVVSIDTTRAAVAEFAMDGGATIINDVSAGRDDERLLPVAAERGAAVVLMHMLGEPKTMQAEPRYDDVVAEVRQFLAERVMAAEAAGIDSGRIVLDPGIGFGKLLEHNLSLLAGVAELRKLGRALLIGASRKRFIGQVTGQDEPRQRVGGSIAAALAARTGGATLFRVHDVAQTRQALDVFDAISRVEA